MNETSPSAVSRRDIRKKDKRSAIVQAAKESFFRSGYGAMSMSGLVATLGGSKATLWSYFRSKEDLFAAVLEDAAGAYGRALAERLMTSDDLHSGLSMFSRDLLEKMLSHEGLELYRLITAESGRFPELGRLFYSQAAGPVEAALATYLRRHRDRGALINEDPSRMGRTLIALCHSLQERRLWGLASLDAAEIAFEASAIADLFLRAYGVAASI